MTAQSYPTQLLRYLGDACRTIDEIVAGIGMTRRQVSDAAAALIRRDYAERVETGCFRLTEEGLAALARGEAITSGPNGPHGRPRPLTRDTLRQRAWTAMRIKRRFALSDLLEVAALGTEGCALNNLQRYCAALGRAQVLRRLPQRGTGSAPTSPGYAIYVLVRDLGETAPSIRGNGALYDHNSEMEIAP